MRDAIIGGLVIATIDNGLGLLGLQAYVNYLVTGWRPAARSLGRRDLPPPPQRDRSLTGDGQ